MITPLIPVATLLYMESAVFPPLRCGSRANSLRKPKLLSIDLTVDTISPSRKDIEAVKETSGVQARLEALQIAGVKSSRNHTFLAAYFELPSLLIDSVHQTKGTSEQL